MLAADLFDIPTVYLMTGFSSAVAAGILLWLLKDHRDSGPALTFFAASVLALGSAQMSADRCAPGLPGRHSRPTCPA